MKRVKDSKISAREPHSLISCSGQFQTNSVTPMYSSTDETRSSHFRTIDGSQTATKKAESLEHHRDLRETDALDQLTGLGHGDEWGHKEDKAFSAHWSKRIQPIAAARTVIINRSGGMNVRNASSTRGADWGTPGWGGAEWSASIATDHPGITNVVTHREKEKKEMQELNSRFAGHIENSKFLDAQNRKLVLELSKLRESWGKDSEKIRALYEVEINQLRQLLDDSERGKGEMEIQLTFSEDKIADLSLELESALKDQDIQRETVDKLSLQLSDYEGEIAFLRRRVSGFESKHENYQKEISQLRADLQKCREDVQMEMVQHADCAGQLQSVQQEMEFNKQIHESEMKELSIMAHRDTITESRTYWKTELAQAIHDIQEEYEHQVDTIRAEYETRYNFKIQELESVKSVDNIASVHLREENEKLRKQINYYITKLPEQQTLNGQLIRTADELRRQLEKKTREFDKESAEWKKQLNAFQIKMELYSKEMQDILDVKLSLEMEIAFYRKLLEMEENRNGDFRLSPSDEEYDEKTGTDLSTLNVFADNVATRDEDSFSVGGSTAQVISSDDYSARDVYSTRDDYKEGRGASHIGEFDIVGSGTHIATDMSNRHLTIPGSGRAFSRVNGINVSSANEVDRDSNVTVKAKKAESPKHTFRRSHKGKVSIGEGDVDGEFIAVENKRNGVQDIGGMKITRDVDKIWSHGKRPKESEDIEAEFPPWGSGEHMFTSLTNAEGEKNDVHIQRSKYP